MILTSDSVINAALTISSLLASPRFDFSKTYFLISCIGGINPKVGTLGSVILARYVVQVDLQHELDARELPSGWSTGYFPQGAQSPNEPPTNIYGTEVYELNSNLRKVAVTLGRNAELKDSQSVRDYCSRYATADHTFQPAAASPSLIEADIAASNIFFHGHLLSNTFSQTCKLFTNGAATYGVTAQEDSGTLAALLQGAVQQKLDFSRIILMRTASNFDQPPSGEAPEIPLYFGHGGFSLAIENIHRVGIKIVRGILEGWDERFENGIPAENYVGDIFGTLGGIPDFVPSI